MFTSDYLRGRVDILGASMNEREEAIATSQKIIASEQKKISEARAVHQTLHGAWQEAQRNVDIFEGRLVINHTPATMASAADVRMDAEVAHAAGRNESQDRP